jgi:hypothetical protein
VVLSSWGNRLKSSYLDEDRVRDWVRVRVRDRDRDRVRVRGGSGLGLRAKGKGPKREKRVG